MPLDLWKKCEKAMSENVSYKLSVRSLFSSTSLLFIAVLLTAMSRPQDHLDEKSSAQDIPDLIRARKIEIIGKKGNILMVLGPTKATKTTSHGSVAGLIQLMNDKGRLLCEIGPGDTYDCGKVSVMARDGSSGAIRGLGGGVELELNCRSTGARILVSEKGRADSIAFLHNDPKTNKQKSLIRIRKIGTQLQVEDDGGKSVVLYEGQ